MSENLIQAAVLIEARIRTLNDRTSTCSCCGVVKYEKFNEYQRKTELAAIVRKLRRFAMS